MDNSFGTSNTVNRPNTELDPIICRCCLTIKNRARNAILYSTHFMDIAGINVTDSDGLPQWVCYECGALLEKTLRFKYKILRAHNILNDYLNRYAPFPIDGAESELAKYSSPQLSATPTLTIEPYDALDEFLGYHPILQHEKPIQKSELTSPVIRFRKHTEIEIDYVKEENSLSDYDDNITLEEYRTNVTKLRVEDLSKVTEDDLAELLEVSERDDRTERRKKRSKKKDREDKVKKKKRNEIVPDEILSEPKASIRKKVDLDPSKIRIVMLNPEDQVKQREAESKAGLKFQFQCHLCYKGFNFEAKLQNHMKKHSPNRGKYECTLCSMYFPTAYSQSVHTIIHTRRFECVICGRRMIDRSSILQHYRSQHEGLLSIYTCQICGKVSNNNKTHRGHMRNHHGGDRPSCDQCGKSFVNKDSLTEHIQIHQGVKHYECSTCGKKFRTRTQMKYHQHVHNDLKDFYCVECDVRFKTAHSLKQHLQKNLKHKDNQSLKFQCVQCEKRFETSARLQHHVSIQHDGVRPHRCHKCPSTLATRDSLRKHISSVHGNAKPPPKHVCDICGKAFRGKSVLINHVRTHTGEKPYECCECGRGFSQRTSMLTHVKLVHLKMRRNAKIKPEPRTAPTEHPKLELFTKEENPLVFEEWTRGGNTGCDVYFSIPPP